MFTNLINEPPYKLTDIFSEVTAHMNSKLRITGQEKIAKDITFRMGYYNEMKAALLTESAPGFTEKKYPFLWLVQPFTIVRGDPAYFGKVKDKLRIFLVMESEKDQRADWREINIFDPMLNPMYVQLLKSMKANPKLQIPVIEMLKHEVTMRYYWGEDQKIMIPDTADCIEVNFEDIIIQNNLNC